MQTEGVETIVQGDSCQRDLDSITQLPKETFSQCDYGPILFYWQERAAFQRAAFRRVTAGNDIVATISISLFLPPPFFLRRDLFS